MNGRAITRYVAVGDSQTEGLWDPDGTGGLLGWADRLAAHLTRSEPHLQYANLAVRGRLVAAVRAEQLEPALGMAPDLVTVMAGLNDVMRPSYEPGHVTSELDAIFSAVRDRGALAVTNTYPDPTGLLPALRPLAALAPRIAEFNDGIRDAAARHGALVVDFAKQGSGTDARIWTADRLHANAVGHALIAAGFADTLGLPGFAAWTTPLPYGVPPGRPRQLITDARWLATTVGPKIVRNVRGRSSGDGVHAKRPRLLPVAPLFHLLDPAHWPATGRYRPASLDAEGFVHLSFADQVTGSADRHFADAKDLVAVELDPRRLGVDGVDVIDGVDVRIEDTYGSGQAYPHAYGPLPVAAAVAVHELARDGTGHWTWR